LLVKTIEDAEAIQPLGAVDAGRLERPDLEQHPKEEDVRAEHERRVVDDFWEWEHIASGLSVE